MTISSFLRDLSYNAIEQLGPDSLPHLPNLKSLLLNNNRLVANMYPYYKEALLLNNNRLVAKIYSYKSKESSSPLQEQVFLPKFWVSSLCLRQNLKYFLPNWISQINEQILSSFLVNLAMSSNWMRYVIWYNSKLSPLYLSRDDETCNF